MMRDGFSSSVMKCRIAISRRATGWLKSISSPTFGFRFAQAGQHDSGGTAAGQQGVGVHMHDRVIAFLRKPRLRRAGRRIRDLAGHVLARHREGISVPVASQASLTR